QHTLHIQTLRTRLKYAGRWSCCWMHGMYLWVRGRISCAGCQRSVSATVPARRAYPWPVLGCSIVG
ncbi:hypothetical protein, partial [Xylella taiwanensis]|uniref:hypothetical protein n=1 Tax=Xylella taiwanensis TaxID=1444770 RepID=UPI001F1C0383